MIKQFEVGDRVKYCGMGYEVDGKIGTVIGTAYAGGYYNVKFDEITTAVYRDALTKVTSDRLIDAAKGRQRHE